MNLEHKKRVLSASAGFLALLAIYYFLGHHGVILVTVLISAAAYYEFLLFSGAGGEQKIPALLAGIALSAWLCLDYPFANVAFYLSAFLVLMRGLLRVHSRGNDSITAEFQHIESRVFGLTYLVLFPSFVPKVHAFPHGPALVLFLIGVIWMGDIGAYYGGKNFGKTKLSPAISPGKTREGALAGLFVSALWAAGLGWYALDYLPIWVWVIIAVPTAVVAQAGDLMESLMKRAYSVKDSGGMIPGHGGVFDRFDSLILAAPFFYLLLRLAHH